MIYTGSKAGGRGPSLLMAGVAGGMVALAGLALPGLAQPERGPPERGQPGASRRGGADVGEGANQAPMGAADLRARLQRRLDDARLIEQRLEHGIESLDAGVAPEQVVRELFAPGMPRGWENRGGDRGMERGDRGPLTEQERERLMVVLRERMPRVAQWVEEERGREPGLFEAVANRLAPQVREIERLRERDPEWARLRMDELAATIAVMRATRMYRTAGTEGQEQGAAREEALATLRAALEAQFDARLASRQHEVAALSRRLDSLREDIGAETAGRGAWIDAAVERITQAAEGPPAREGQPAQGP